MTSFSVFLCTQLPPDDQLSESHLLQDVYFTRHRLDLMFRIAHMNRDKTRLLFRSMGTVDMDEVGMVPVDTHRSRLEDSLRLSRVVSSAEPTYIYINIHHHMYVYK